MSKKKKQNNPPEKQNSEVVAELHGNIEEVDINLDLENDITGMGDSPDDDIIVASAPRKNRFFFGFAVFTVIMAIIGVVSCVIAISSGIRNIVDNTSLKKEFERFLLPIVANDISTFRTEAALADSTKVRCAIWNILINDDVSQYKSAVEGEYLIPEYNVDLSCKELFGSDAELSHRTVSYGDVQFTYYGERHVYSCARDFRYLTYAPKIAEMTEQGGTYTLEVEYISPTLSMLAEDLELESTADKTMIYTVTRDNGKITLVSVEFPETNNTMV